VVFQRKGATYLKRVLAVGGGSFPVVRYTDDTPDSLVPHWQLDKLLRAKERPAFRHSFKLVSRTVPVGSVYVVGDHLEDSTDSRDFGYVGLEQIQGKVLFAPPPHEAVTQLAGAGARLTGS
jgi:signal peptidase I